MADLHRTRRRTILRGRGANRVIVGIFLAALLTWCAGAMAAAGTDLYRTKVTVTGQGEANRIVGFAASLEDVLIKASGAQKLSGDRRLAAYKIEGQGFRQGIQLSRSVFGKPIRDEQGTRDRPFDLTVEFEEEQDRRHSQGARPQALAFASSSALPSLSRWSRARGTMS